MTSGRPPGWDPLAAIAALIALVMMVAYLAIIAHRHGDVAVGFLGGMAVAALLAAYGAARAAPRRRLALAAAGTLLTLLGLLGILSVGLPIVAAGVLAVIAAVRAPGGSCA